MSTNEIEELVLNSVKALYNKDFQRLFQVKTEVIPKLYKYFSVSPDKNNNKIYSIENLKNDNIFCQNIKNFNDPYDGFAGISKDFVTEQAKNLSSKAAPNYEMVSFVETANDLFDSCDNLHQELSENYRVCCFSESYNHPLMWAHYADKHQGFCLEYDFCSSLDSIEQKLALLGLFPVIYQKNRLNLNDLFLHFRDHFSLNDKVGYVFHNLIILLTKYDIWKYEREWRLIKKICNSHDSDSLHIPCATKIFLGYNMDKQIRSEIIDIAKSKKIKIFHMQLDYASFDLLDNPI